MARVRAQSQAALLLVSVDGQPRLALVELGDHRRPPAHLLLKQRVARGLGDLAPELDPEAQRGLRRGVLAHALDQVGDLAVLPLGVLLDCVENSHRFFDRRGDLTHLFRTSGSLLDLRAPYKSKSDSNGAGE